MLRAGSSASIASRCLRCPKFFSSQFVTCGAVDHAAVRHELTSCTTCEFRDIEDCGFGTAAGAVPPHPPDRSLLEPLHGSLESVIAPTIAQMLSSCSLQRLPKSSTRANAGQLCRSACGNGPRLRPSTSSQHRGTVRPQPASDFTEGKAPLALSTPTGGLYRKEIDESRGLVPFGSPHGKQMLMEAMVSGAAEAYFPLAEQFLTQSDPPFCGPSTIVMVLNSLQVDPQRVWKGPWRWYSEEMLRHCAPLDLSQGVTMEQFAHLAESNRTDAEVFYAGQGGTNLKEFRLRIQAVLRDAEALSRVVVSFDRGTLGQTGSGHYSPIAAFHEQRDAVLVMDVARFKYPPYWVPLPLLWQAMQEFDPITGRSRGYFVVSTVDDNDHELAPLGMCGIGMCGLGGSSNCATSRPCGQVPRFAETVLSRLSAHGRALTDCATEGAGPLLGLISMEVIGTAARCPEARRALRSFSRLLRVWLANEPKVVESAFSLLRSSDLHKHILASGGAAEAPCRRGLWRAHPQRAEELCSLLVLALARPLLGPGGPLEESDMLSEAGQRCRALFAAMGGTGVATTCPGDGWESLRQMNHALQDIFSVAGHDDELRMTHAQPEVV